jgi:hypothetical protein
MYLSLVRLLLVLSSEKLTGGFAFESLQNNAVRQVQWIVFAQYRLVLLMVKICDER